MRDVGHAAVELGLGIGLLLLPVALAVLAFGPWSESRVFAEAAAAEAARATVLQLDTESGRAVLEEMASNHGLEGSAVRLGWCGASPVALPGSGPTCSFVRGGNISAEVQIWTPLVATPWGNVGGIWVTGTHSEPVDLYRSLG